MRPASFRMAYRPAPNFRAAEIIADDSGVVKNLFSRRRPLGGKIAPGAQLRRALASAIDAGVAPREDQLPSEARPQNQVRRRAPGTVGPAAGFWSRRRPSTSCRNWSRLAFTSARSWRKPKTSTSRITGSRVNSSRRSPVDRVEPPRFSETSPGRLRAGVCAGADRADLRCLRLSIIADISPRESGPGAGVSWSFDSPPR